MEHRVWAGGDTPQSHEWSYVNATDIYAHRGAIIFCWDPFFVGHWRQGLVPTIDLKEIAKLAWCSNFDMYIANWDLCRGLETQLSWAKLSELLTGSSLLNTALCEVMMYPLTYTGVSYRR